MDLRRDMTCGLTYGGRLRAQRLVLAPAFDSDSSALNLGNRSALLGGKNLSLAAEVVLVHTDFAIQLWVGGGIHRFRGPSPLFNVHLGGILATLTLFPGVLR